MVEDPSLRAHPALVEQGVRAYLGCPIHLPDSTPVGALCVLDTRPRTWRSDQVHQLQDLAACVDETIALAGALETAQEAEVSQARAVQARDMFLLGMQHEIRTQLNGILGFSEVLKDLAPEPEAKSLGDDIGRCGERLCALLTPLVEERDRSVRQPPARPFHTRDLRELFGEIDVVVRSQGQPGRLQVHLQGAPDARLRVRVAERVRLMV